VENKIHASRKIVRKMPTAITLDQKTQEKHASSRKDTRLTHHGICLPAAITNLRYPFSIISPSQGKRSNSFMQIKLQNMLREQFQLSISLRLYITPKSKAISIMNTKLLCFFKSKKPMTQKRLGCSPE